uniref:Uncharacterized protein n=1 Tax=Oryza sativa subsp. japonica TaxID=39947 RepID=Q8LIA5_ORYSJ|nr:hypothetical protein [Oryza sativa Japonica Group]
MVFPNDAHPGKSVVGKGSEGDGRNGAGKSIALATRGGGCGGWFRKGGERRWRMTVAKAVGDLATVTVAWRRGARRRRRHIWKGRDGDDAVVADGGGGRPTGKRKEAAQLGLGRLG